MDRANETRAVRKFLFDEQLTPDLVADAIAHGHEAACVSHLGWSGVADRVLVNHAFDKNYILVTQNVRDFRKLLNRVELHPGLICFEARDNRFNATRQRAMFKAALELLDERGDLMNLELDMLEQPDGSYVATFRPLP
ncbi:MAG: DUF5615 family PIN-like protein [Archangium sp.]